MTEDFDDVERLYNGPSIKYEDLPKRCTAITRDDVTDLVIALETCKTLDEFLAIA